MDAFSTFNLDTSHAYPQTIIRIPLRTQTQAATSRICPREVSGDEIRLALEQFAKEMEDGGLLFLKNMRKIILRVDDAVLAQIQILGDEDTFKIRNELSLDFKSMYVPESTLPLHVEICKGFEMQVQCTIGENSSIHHYLVQHYMKQSSSNSKLDEWARERKLFPWVAVAAPLHVSYISLHLRN